METPGLDNERYFMAITDEASGFSHSYVYKTKHSNFIVSDIKAYIKLMEKQSGQKAKELVCDGGTEFINKELITFMETNGIMYNQSNPDTPQQNGIAERKNATLVEAARSCCSLLCWSLPIYQRTTGRKLYSQLRLF